MIVREALSNDFQAVAEITAREILEGYAHFGTEPPSPEELLQDWEQSRETYPFFVACEEDRVIGFAKASPWKSRGGYATTCEIGVYVHHEFQRRGTAVALYSALFAQLERRGFHTIIAGIALPNEPSIRLHERVGMKHVGTLPEVGYKFGRRIDVGYWVKVLRKDEG